ncbi:hypothetical protein PHYBOEH_008786 [Phytophthora boehmeriae]|uniref:Uncharacterized protein n=1 Tax=Phytophthora boehmeriae TaxID=109152 RepID=A0A8T1W0R7_9STRA|nr:hypothetical protein PHYBOEH_008786 [Phytophthora boehmeriae]
MKDLQDEVEALRGDGQEAAVNRKSEMRELQEIVNKLQQDLNGRAALVAQLQRDLKAQQPASDDGEVIQMQATMKSGEIICWKNIGLNVVMVVNGMDGTICPLNSGIYQVMVVVDHHATTQNLSIKLMKDAECIQAAYCGSSQGQHGSTSLVCTVRMTTADQLTVKCSANLTSTSYLTLVRLGK